jgi:FixJ family two-component response regulator
MAQKTQESHSVSIVDDDQAVRDALGNLLDSAGLDVEAFASAEEFVNSDRPKDEFCLILDVRLPNMSGLELQRYLSDRARPVPIIFITGHADAAVREQAMRDGALGFFYKPFDSEALLNAVCSVLK